MWQKDKKMPFQQKQVSVVNLNQITSFQIKLLNIFFIPLYDYQDNSAS